MAAPAGAPGGAAINSGGSAAHTGGTAGNRSGASSDEAERMAQMQRLMEQVLVSSYLYESRNRSCAICSPPRVRKASPNQPHPQRSAIGALLRPIGAHYTSVELCSLGCRAAGGNPTAA